MTPEATATPKKAARLTEYVILECDKNETSLFRLVSTKAQATRGEDAIDGWVAHDPHDGTFVAVPARSWRPLPVKIETKTSIKVG